MGEKLGAWAVQFLIDHYEGFGWGLLVYVLLSGLVTGLTAVYPDYTLRPKWARFIVGGLESFVVNGWRLVMAIFGKIGINLKPLPCDSGDHPLPPKEKP